MPYVISSRFRNILFHQQCMGKAIVMIKIVKRGLKWGKLAIFYPIMLIIRPRTASEGIKVFIDLIYDVELVKDIFCISEKHGMCRNISQNHKKITKMRQNAHSGAPGPSGAPYRNFLRFFFLKMGSPYQKTSCLIIPKQWANYFNVLRPFFTKNSKNGHFFRELCSIPGFLQ